MVGKCTRFGMMGSTASLLLNQVEESHTIAQSNRWLEIVPRSTSALASSEGSLHRYQQSGDDLRPLLRGPRGANLGPASNC